VLLAYIREQMEAAKDSCMTGPEKSEVDIARLRERHSTLQKIEQRMIEIAGDPTHEGREI